MPVHFLLARQHNSHSLYPLLQLRFPYVESVRYDLFQNGFYFFFQYYPINYSCSSLNS
jgi:hypothetical protein